MGLGNWGIWPINTLLWDLLCAGHGDGWWELSGEEKDTFHPHEPFAQSKKLGAHTFLLPLTLVPASFPLEWLESPSSH